MPDDDGNHWDWPLISKRCSLEAKRILRRHDDAEEAVQEALLRAWRSRNNCRSPEARLAWCLQITRNEALRLVGRRPPPSVDASDPLIQLHLEPSDSEAERVVERIDLARALMQLPLQQRLLIELRYRRDHSHPQIAEKLAIPEATARVRLHRAHKRLKDLLEVA
jgi:RNA polymerase sigma-70 factor, ECF subfamily